MSDVRLGADTSDTAEGGRRPGGVRLDERLGEGGAEAGRREHGQVVHAHHVDGAPVAGAGLEHQGATLRHAQGGDGHPHRQLRSLEPQQLAPAPPAAVGPAEHLAAVGAEGRVHPELAQHRVVGEQRALDAPLVGAGDGRPRDAGGGHPLAGRAPPGERREDPVGERYGVGGQRVGKSRWAVHSAPGPGRRRAQPPRPASRRPSRAIATDAR